MHIAKYPFIFDQKKTFSLFKRSRAFSPSSSVHTNFPTFSQQNSTTANHTHQRTTRPLDALYDCLLDEPQTGLVDIRFHFGYPLCKM
jgi:hypothetical protein